MFLQIKNITCSHLFLHILNLNVFLFEFDTFSGTCVNSYHIYICILLPLFLYSDAHEKAMRELNTQLKETQKAKEATLREVNELKTQLKMVEESRDTVRRDLIEAHRKIREGEILIWNFG